MEILGYKIKYIYTYFAKIWILKMGNSLIHVFETMQFIMEKETSMFLDDSSAFFKALRC